jgi:hypothetical protein
LLGVYALAVAAKCLAQFLWRPIVDLVSEHRAEDLGVDRRQREQREGTRSRCRRQLTVFVETTASGDLAALFTSNALSLTIGSW